MTNESFQSCIDCDPFTVTPLIVYYTLQKPLVRHPGDPLAMEKVRQCEIHMQPPRPNCCKIWLSKFPTRSKRIDVISRITFPLVFALFNLVYWMTYLFREEAEENWWTLLMAAVCFGFMTVYMLILCVELKQGELWMLKLFYVSLDSMSMYCFRLSDCILLLVWFSEWY